MDCKGRVRLSSPETDSVGIDPGFPCQEWGASATQALVLLRPLPKGGQGHGAGGGQLQEEQGVARRAGCWLRARLSPSPRAAHVPWDWLGVPVGPFAIGSNGGSFDGQPQALRLGHQRSQPLGKGGEGVGGVQNHNKMPLSWPRIVPALLIWKKTEREATLKCRFLTPPKAREK